MFEKISDYVATNRTSIKRGVIIGAGVTVGIAIAAGAYSKLKGAFPLESGLVATSDLVEVIAK